VVLLKVVSYGVILGLRQGGIVVPYANIDKYLSIDKQAKTPQGMEGFCPNEKCHVRYFLFSSPKARNKAYFKEVQGRLK
jgi:hypothetical protein